MAVEFFERSQLLDQLQRGSFNDIPFLIKKATTTGGRKVVTHEFVRSDIRVVEDLGLENRTFHITAIISGFDYLLKRENLLRNLELEGQGTLQHPLYGRVTVTPLPYSIKEDLQKAGMAIIEMSFEEAAAQSQPLPNSFFSNALAEEIAGFLNGFIREEFVKKFKIPGGSFGNFSDAVSQNNNSGNFFGSALSSQGQTASNSEYTNSLKNYNDSASTFVTNPSDFAESTEDLFNQSQTLYDTPANAFVFLSTGFDFSSVGITLEVNTQSNTDRENNRKASVDIMRGLALSAAYNQAAQIEFQTEDGLLTVKDQLDTSFNEIVNNNRLDNDSIDQLEKLRNVVNVIFNQKSVNLFRTEQIEVQTQPVGLITFNHYGDTDLEQELVSLNMVFNPSFINGDFTILTR